MEPTLTAEQWLAQHGRARYNPRRRRDNPKSVPITRARYDAFVSGDLGCPCCGDRLVAKRKPNGGVFWCCMHGQEGHVEDYFWVTFSGGYGYERRTS